MSNWICGWNIRTICKTEQSKPERGAGKHRGGWLSFSLSRQKASNLVTTSSLWVLGTWNVDGELRHAEGIKYKVDFEDSIQKNVKYLNFYVDNILK